jgi:hypothetical protein
VSSSWASGPLVAAVPEVLVAAVQPAVDPGAVWLIGDRGAVSQRGQPCLSVTDHLQDLGQWPVRKIMPFSAIARASSEAWRCRKPDGSAVEPWTGAGEAVDIVQF